LRHANAFNPKKQTTLDKKLSKLESIQREKGSIVGKHISSEMIESIYEWKKKRNPLCHALLKQELSSDYLRSLAEEGNLIARTLCNKSSSYRRFVTKMGD